MCLARSAARRITSAINAAATMLASRERAPAVIPNAVPDMELRQHDVDRYRVDETGQHRVRYKAHEGANPQQPGDEERAPVSSPRVCP
jgi:hypothetical protein